jgi:hypothetical protein
VKHAAARWFYNQLKLKQPHLDVRGLHVLGRRYLIVVVNASTAVTSDGTELSEWVKGHHLLHAPTVVVEAPPDGAEAVPEQSLEQFLRPTGLSLSLPNLYLELALFLPRAFPDFRLINGAGTLEVSVSRKLAPDDVSALDEAIEQLQVSLPYTISEDPSLTRARFQKRTRDILRLLPSRALPDEAGKALRTLSEEDEDYWKGSRAQIYTHEDADVDSALPSGWEPGPSRCVVPTSVFEAQNIRNYLSLYREVVLVAPMAPTDEKILTSLRCTKKDLVRLAQAGRIRFLLPQALDQYDLHWLSEMAEAAPSSLLLSRRLAAATVIDTRRRLPFLYPAFSPEERHRALKVLTRAASSISDPNASRFAVELARELGRLYADAEAMIHERGALATSTLGVGAITSAIYKSAGRDFTLEFWSAASAVEWGALLGGTVFPVVAEKYSEERATEIVAALYSGVPVDSPQPVPSDLLEALGGLLSVNNDAPLDDFISAFGGGDVDRLRTLVATFGAQHDVDARAAALADFNKQVRDYERSIERTKSWDLVSLLGVLGPLLLPGPAKYIGIGSWLLRRVLAGHQLGKVDNATAGKLIDALNGPVTKSGADVVLVSRLRKAAKG